MIRKINILTIAIILTSVIATFFSSCQEDESKLAELDSISIKTMPTKVDYYIGEVLDLSGLVIVFNMDNGKTEDVAFLDFGNKGIICSPINGTELTTALTVVSIIHTATGLSINQSIGVSEVEVTSISIKSAPEKIDYYLGEVLELSGLVITISKNNGDTEDVIYSDFKSKGITCSLENGELLTLESTDLIITHAESSKTVNQVITVSDVTSISIKKSPTIIDYYLAETLDLSGLEVTLNLSNGSTRDIIYSDFVEKGIICSPINGEKITREIKEVLITHNPTAKSASQIINLNKLIDVDQNDYLLTKIGNQIWMAENLKTTHYSDGSEIRLVEDCTDWQDLLYTDPAYCYFDNSSVNGEIYGALYTWSAAMKGSASSSTNPSNVQGACPDGWHIPSKEEWTQLTDYLSSNGHSGTEGLALKSTSLWANDEWFTNGNGTDDYGFSALPANARTALCSFLFLGGTTHFWSSTEYDNSKAWNYKLYYNSYTAFLPNYVKDNGFSVRCIKD